MIESIYVIDEETIQNANNIECDLELQIENNMSEKL